MSSLLPRITRASALLFATLVPIGLCHAQSTFIVTNPMDSGAGSLRDAITNANANADRSTIDFRIDPAVSGPGPWTIALATELPEFTAPVLIRGYSQPGSAAASTPLSARIMIEIDDSAIGADPNSHGGILTFVRGSEMSAVNGLSLVGTRAAANSPSAFLVLADGVRVNANWIGVRANGTLSRYAGAAISAVCANNVVIGGNTTGDGNLIGGSDSSAINLTGANHLVRNNWIGFDRFGSSTFNNFIAGDGVATGSIAYLAPSRLATTYSAAVQQTFFGLRTSTIADNRISSIRFNGVALRGTNNPTSGNIVARNTFGRDAYGGSGAHVDIAVRLDRGATNNSVTDNLVGNANAGIVLGSNLNNTIQRAGNGNQLRRNVIFAVAQRAIALNPDTHFAPLANDALDADTGANGLQNKPQVVAASTGGGLVGTLNSEPGKTYTLEFYVSNQCHPSGFDRAEFYLGETSVTTDNAGAASFSTRATQQPVGGLVAGKVVTATATDGAGNTSELSSCVPLAAAAAPTLTLAPIPTPSTAMDRSFPIAATISSASTRQPTGELVFFVATATDVREIGRRAIVGGQAAVPVPTAGFFPHAGHYDVYVEYAGDGFNTPARSATQTVVVFRPPSALEDPTWSSPIRREIGGAGYEYYETMSGSWRGVNIGASETFVDTDRFDGSTEDNAFFGEPGRYLMLSRNANVRLLPSMAIGPDTQVLDLVHLDGDVRVDAVVRDRQTMKYGIVRCAFLVDNCEKAFPLEVNVEYVYAFSGDFNGDGHADLVFRNDSSNETEILLMIGEKPFDRYTLRPRADERAVTAADVNGDGYDDLVSIDEPAAFLYATLMHGGRPYDVAGSKLPSSKWTTPGMVHVAKPGDSDYGTSQLVLRDESTGEVVIWRKPVISSGGMMSKTPVPLYFDPRFVVERTR